MSITDSFVEEYLALPEGSSGRGKLELRYGKANLARLIAKREEDRANAEWLENRTSYVQMYTFSCSPSPQRRPCARFVRCMSKSPWAATTYVLVVRRAVEVYSPQSQITCGKCRNHFCYRCGDKIDGQNPYSHFSTPGALAALHSGLPIDFHPRLPVLQQTIRLRSCR
jgi:E3 ubiquitin-protein ligase RNF14